MSAAVVTVKWAFVDILTLSFPVSDDKAAVLHNRDLIATLRK